MRSSRTGFDVDRPTPAGVWLAILLAVLPGRGLNAAPAGDWKDQANARIEILRKRDAEAVFIDAEGRPLGHAQVDVRQVGKQFPFGAAMSKRQSTRPFSRPTSTGPFSPMNASGTATSRSAAR